MKKASFEKVKTQLAEACESLRSFTLARDGYGKKDGIAAIEQVTEICNQLDKLFAKGPHAGESRTLVATARPQVLAAKARLALLQSL